MKSSILQISVCDGADSIGRRQRKAGRYGKYVRRDQLGGDGGAACCLSASAVKGRIIVGHKCDEKSLVVIKEDGVLTTYKCPVCGKEFSEIGSIVITDDKDLLMCEIYIKWSEDSSVVSQISKLKKLIPVTKKISNNTLLEAARKGKSLKVAEMFSAEAYELLEQGKMMGVILQVM